MVQEAVIGSVPEILRAGIVTESFPYFIECIEWRGGEALDVGKGFEKSMVVRDDRCDPRLLQHSLGYPCRIGGAILPPWENSFVLIVPMKEFCCSFFWVHRRNRPFCIGGYFETDILVFSSSIAQRKVALSRE